MPCGSGSKFIIYVLQHLNCEPLLLVDPIVAVKHCISKPILRRGIATFGSDVAFAHGHELPTATEWTRVCVRHTTLAEDRFVQQ
eukprot:SAG11_NODE_144_length_14830_cov_17.955943_11_plen_84_part_00